MSDTRDLSRNRVSEGYEHPEPLTEIVGQEEDNPNYTYRVNLPPADAASNLSDSVEMTPVSNEEAEEVEGDEGDESEGDDSEPAQRSRRSRGG